MCIRDRSRSLETRYIAGVFHVTSNRPVPYSKLYKRFLKAAKKAGLEHTYIIRKNRTSPYALIRVDLSTGKEELVEGNYNAPSREQFKRMHAISKEENVYNLDPAGGKGLGIISPKAILLEDMELDITPSRARHIDEAFYELRH